MPTLDRETPETRIARTGADADRRRAEAAALWSALRADRRAQDERTAKLRAMLLAVGEDAHR